jgi:chemotaxis protein MotA
MVTWVRRSLELFVRAPLVGLALGFALVLGAVTLSTGSLFAFFSIEGLVIVVGGVIAVAYLSFEAEDVNTALGVIAAMVKQAPEPPPDTLHRDMTEIIAWASVVKEKGVRWLETSLAKSGIADPFVKYGLNMVVSGYAPEDVRAMMETAADAAHERDSLPVDVLQSMTSHAPAFGMIGTLVGMVAMLSTLGDNVGSVGSSLSVAFLSTLYGVVSARVLYMPAAAKLRQIASKRRFRNQLVTEGMVLLVGNRSPMYVKDRLNSFLKPEWHDYTDSFKSDRAPAPALPQAAPPARLKAVAA